jgi:hypothetical protein
MDLTDKGAVEAAVAYNALLSFMAKLDLLPDGALDWLTFRISGAMHGGCVGTEYEFLRAARELVRLAKES